MNQTSQYTPKKIALTLLKFGVVIGAFAFLIGTDRLRLDDLGNILSSPKYVAIGIGLTLFPMLVSFLRYHYLLKALGIDLGMKEITRLGFIGCFFNTFMPGSMGGDIVKVAYIIRDTGKRAPVIASAAVDRVLGMLGMVVMGGAVMLWAFGDVMRTPSLHKLTVAVFTIVLATFFCGVTSVVTLAYQRVAGLVSWLLLTLATGYALWLLLGHSEFHPVCQPGETVSDEILMRSRIAVSLLCCVIGSLACVAVVPSCQPGRSLERFVSLRIPFGRKLMSFVHSLLAYRHSPGAFLLASFLSLVTHGTNMLALYFFARAAQLEHLPSVQDIFFAAPVAFIANSLPVPGGGLGVGEAAFDSLLALCRTPEGAVITGGAAVFLIWRFWYIVLGLAGLPFYLKGKAKIQQAEADYLEHEESGENDDLSQIAPDEGTAQKASATPAKN